MNGGLGQSTSSLFSSCQQLSSGEITVVFFFLKSVTMSTVFAFFDISHSMKRWSVHLA